jgi:hypothetical protein
MRDMGRNEDSRSSWPGTGERKRRRSSNGYVPAIHVFGVDLKDVDARDKRGHDE